MSTLRASLVLTATVIIAVVRAFTAGHPLPPERLEGGSFAQVGRAAAAKEPEWRAKSKKSFPGDHWSQDDDFHNAEHSWAKAEARSRKVPVADVLRAVDADLRTHPPEPPRRATVAQCRPRPFYD